MMVNNLKYTLGQNMNRLDKLQNQLATGHRINRPSDDPTGIVNTLRYKSTITESEKYLQNISGARNFLNSTDSALGNVTEIIHRADELIVQGLTDSNSQQSREALAAEMRQLREQIVVIANTTFGSKHIFGGTNITQGPLQTDPTAAWIGNDQTMELEIGVGATIATNSTMEEVFFNGDPDNPGLYQLLENIATHLENGDTAGLNNDLTLIQGKLDAVSEERAIIGAKVNRLDLQENRLENSTINYEELLSINQDADIAQVILNLKMQENVYRASLSAGARIIQPSLVDFLS